MKYRKVKEDNVTSKKDECLLKYEMILGVKKGHEIQLVSVIVTDIGT